MPGLTLGSRSRASHPLGLSSGAPSNLSLKQSGPGSWAHPSPSLVSSSQGKPRWGSRCCQCPSCRGKPPPAPPGAQLGFSESGQQEPAAAAFIWKALSFLPDGEEAEGQPCTLIPPIHPGPGPQELRVVELSPGTQGRGAHVQPWAQVASVLPGSAHQGVSPSRHPQPAWRRVA